MRDSGLLVELYITMETFVTKTKIVYFYIQLDNIKRKNLEMLTSNSIFGSQDRNIHFFDFEFHKFIETILVSQLYIVSKFIILYLK